MNHISPNRFASVLPHIIGILHSEPHQSATVDDLCHAVEACALMDEAMMRHICSFDTLTDAVYYGMELGKNMGLLAHSNGIIRIPFKLAKRSPGDENQRHVEVEYVDLRSSVEQRKLPCNSEESVCNASDEELQFSDENGEPCYSVDEPRIPGRVLRSAMNPVTGTVSLLIQPTDHGPTNNHPS
ncbi:GL26523 [Drosophila persimilis]|uniref:GL26523 n=1 Tax=Drosophila persimilis TaxID=7234 RepID=B4GSF1_DROPE|nr:GL26523 [Drosophila persimilis]